MTDLEFRNGLVENAFTWGNQYYCDDNVTGTGLFFTKEKNYPFIFRSGKSDEVELQYSQYAYQLRHRALTVKKIKEILNGCPLPIILPVKSKYYLMGKGFLCTYVQQKVGELLFVACANQETVTSIDQVKFFISKKIYHEDHKPFHPVIKELIASHSGDIIICSDLLDYMTEKIYIPQGGSIADRKKYTDAVVRTTIEEVRRRVLASTTVQVAEEEDSVLTGWD